MDDEMFKELERIVNGDPAQKTNSNKEAVLNLHRAKEKEKEYRKFKMLNHIAADLCWLALGVTAMSTAFHFQCKNELEATISFILAALMIVGIVVFDVKEGKL